MLCDTVRLSVVQHEIAITIFKDILETHSGRCLFSVIKV